MFVTQLNQLKNLVAMGKSIIEISKTMKLSKYEVKFALDKNNLKSDQANNEFNLNLIRAYISDKDEFTAQEIAAFYNLNVKQVESLLKTISNINMKETKKTKIKSKGNSYTQKDDDFILECKRKGLSNKYIASNLNPKRGSVAVSVRYSQLRKKLPVDQLPPLLGKYQNKKKVEKTTLTLDDQLEITKLWSKGLSKESIAKEMGLSLKFIEDNWSEVSGLGKANDDFVETIQSLYLKGDTIESILKLHSKIDKTRLENVFKELEGDFKIKVSKTTLVNTKLRKGAWSKLEDRTILRLSKEGKTHEEIGKEVGRTKFAITNRLWRLNNCTIPVKIPKIESCETIKPSSDDPIKPMSVREMVDDLKNSLSPEKLKSMEDTLKFVKGDDFDADKPKVETTSSAFKATIPNSEFQKGMESLWNRKTSTSRDQTLEMFKQALESEVKDQTIVFIIKK